MRHVISKYHDAQITKIEHRQNENVLIVGLTLTDLSKWCLTFSKVIGWEFSPFSFQNFLLDFKVYAYDNLPQVLIEDYEVFHRYIDLMKSTGANFFEFNPASGMGGYVIATDFEVAPDI